MDDGDSIHRMKGGDIGGLEALVRRYQVRAVRAAFLVTHDEALAEDVVQETFIRVYQRIRHFDEARPFEPYFMRSVVNAALNAIRHEHRSASLDAEPVLLESLLEKARSIEARVELAQLTQEVLVALSELSPRQRAVIVLRYYLEMSEREMAETLGAAPGTVKWLLNAARTRLRKLLRPERNAE